MKIIVTVGQSYEPGDQTRRLTNFSTAKIAIKGYDAVAYFAKNAATKGLPE